MKKPQPYWKKNKVPAEEGWYWCKYRGKNGVVVCPCSVMHLKESFSVHTARNDSYTSNTAKQFGTIWFGKKIKAPGA